MTSLWADGALLACFLGRGHAIVFPFVGLAALTAQLTPVILSNLPLGARSALAAPWYHLPDTRGIFTTALSVFLGLVTHITRTTSVTMSGVFLRLITQTIQ